MSTAPDLSRLDRLTSLKRAKRQPLMLGLFWTDRVLDLERVPDVVPMADDAGL